jgi:hypothetical protein
MKVTINELMLRYAQDKRVSNVAECLRKGADVDYEDGALLLIAMYVGSSRLLKLALAHKPTKGLQEAVDLAEKMDDDDVMQLLNEYLTQENITL